MERTKLHYCKSVCQHTFHEQRNFGVSSPVSSSFVDRETRSCPRPHPMWATDFLSNIEQIIQHFPPVENANIVEDGQKVGTSWSDERERERRFCCGG